MKRSSGSFAAGKGCYFFLIKSNQKSSDKKSFHAPCRFYFSPQLKVKTSIPASAGPLFITALRSFVFKPSPSGRVGRGVSDSGLLLAESGKTMLACGWQG
jgi:hypothetical protein